VSYAAITNRQRKELYPVEFQPVNWQPQVEVTFTRDVTGWVDREKRIRFQFNAGSTHMVDEQHAVEFIVKGYATGTLPREVSQDERDELRSVMTTIGLGQAR
jgi:hypothetical protein